MMRTTCSRRGRRHRAAALTLVLALLATHARPEVTLELANDYRYISRGDVTIGAFTFVPIPLGKLRAGSAVDFSITSSNSQPYAIELLPDAQLSARLDELNRSLAFWRQPPALNAVPLAPLSVVVPQEGPYSAILISQNWRNFFGSDAVHLESGVRMPLSPTEHAELQKDFGLLVLQVNKTFDASFKVRVVACGTSNARSDLATGDITFCTERQTDSASLDAASGELRLNLGVRNAIFFHELGHSLLSRWKLPGADTEIVADQFALFMLLHYEQGEALARQWEASLRNESNPPWETLQIQRGDMHPLNEQRANQIRMYLDNPDATRDFFQHWANLVYPHMRGDYLRRLSALPAPRELVDNARAELRRRGETSP